MQAEIGKNADDPGADRNRYRRLRVAVKELPNGNVEEQYDLIRNPVYFEIDKVTRKIVNWRYEGRKTTAGLLPS
jgi:hypothetical protein